MKPSEITAGKIYANKGAGRNQRKVLRIKHGLNCLWFSNKPRPADEPVVEFKNLKDGTIDRLYMKSFASWAGKVV